MTIADPTSDVSGALGFPRNVLVLPHFAYGLSYALESVRALLVALVISIAPPSAWSGGTGIVAPPHLAPRAATELVAAMQLSGVVRPIPDAVAEARRAVASGATSLETLRWFRRVRDQIDEGWRAYHTVQFDVAAGLFAAARKDAELLLTLSSGAVPYADATLRLGVVLARQGRVAEARDAIALALALDPDRPISPREFAPEIIAVIDAVRAEPRPSRPVMLTSEPSGAMVTIDGRDVGRAPVTVELTVGPHIVGARLPQFRAGARPVVVTSATTTIPFGLTRDDVEDRFAAAGGGDLPASDMQQLIDGVLLYADLDDVVLAVETEVRGEPALLAQRCAGVPAKCTAIVEVNYGDRSGLAVAARTVWQDVRSRDLRGAPSLFADPRAVPQRRDPPRCRLCRNPYVLAGAGVALVAGAVAIVAVVTASRPPPVLTIDPSMFSR